MWYDAASVVMAIEQCNSLTVSSSHLPSCPKKGNNVHCHSDFPDCEGKAQGCHQSLQLANERGDPSILYFDYYDSSDTRRGRIKKKNSTLLLLIKRYGIDERLMVAL
jgi:hypothetical protein